MRTHKTLIAALACVAIALAGCGGNGDGDGDTADGPVVIEASEFAFEPKDVTIAADSDVEITLVNVGMVEHDWTIDELDVHIHVDVGETATTTVNAPAGTYEAICAIPGHAAAGMVGTLVVQ